MAASLADKGMRGAAKNDPLWSYKFRVLKAEIIAFARPDEALDLLSVPPPRELSSGEFAGSRKLIQGLAYGLRHEYPQAKSSFEEAGHLINNNPDLLVRLALNQAYVFYLAKNKTAAEEQYSSAIDLAHKYGLPRMEATAHISLGKLLMDQEIYDRAINEFNLALPLVRSSQIIPLEHHVLGNMGWSYFQVGDFENAAATSGKAAEIAAQIHDTANQEQWIRNIGILFYVQGNYAQAEAYYQKSLALAQQTGNKDAISINYHNLAQLELHRNRVGKAENYNKLAYQAKGLSSKDRSDFYLLLTSAEIALFKKDFAEAEEYFNYIIQNVDDTSLRWQAQSDMANLCMIKGDNAKAEAFFAAGLSTIEAARTEIKQEDRRMSILDAWPFYDDYIRFLASQGKKEKALQIAEFSRGRTLAEAFGITEAQKETGLRVPVIKNFLRKGNQTILAYWISTPESYLWVITPTKFELFHLPDKEKIDRAIDAYKDEVSQRGDIQDSARGQALYEMLVRPAERFLSRNAKVIIIPNRNLYQLNFETLVVPGPAPHYWIEDTVLENASSIALLVQSRRRSNKGQKKLLLMGAPVQVTDEFPSLLFATEEIRSVQDHFSRSQETVFAGPNATPRAYKTAEPGKYQFIHLVTHGTRSQTSPLDSAIILSSDADKSFKLYARDIKDIGLHADLVTISACYGAGEKASSGEGLVGLAWAFMRAGSHQVVAALWEVGDSTMPKLMDHFYSELGSGKSPPEALRAAKLDILRSKDFHKRPYYWASLQLYTGP